MRTDSQKQIMGINSPIIFWENTRIAAPPRVVYYLFVRTNNNKINKGKKKCQNLKIKMESVKTVQTHTTAVATKNQNAIKKCATNKKNTPTNNVGALYAIKNYLSSPKPIVFLIGSTIVSLALSNVRINARRILPLIVIGNVSTYSIIRGHL